MLDLNGRPAFTIFKEQRIEIPLAKVSPILQKAILSIEDQRFYDHRGVDTIRVVGSALANLKMGRRAQGASTLTQQLARQSFLTLDKTYRRKFQEIIVAAELESQYSKSEILELYLNKVYFGDGLHGIEAAALGYFGKHDQGLIPVKLLAFGQAVNVTLGLPIVRTSVDHGTAFDIAGRGVADPASMIEAVKLAARLAPR